MNALSPRWKYLISALSGAAMVLAFAPFDQVWLVFVGFAWLQLQWRDASPKTAFMHAGLFGFGLQSAGISWIYVSLHYHGGTPALFAGVMIALLSIYLALYPALAAYVVARFCKTSATLKTLLLFPAAWMLSEWLQGYVMTGFAWMQLGYTQIDSPLAGFAPLLGAHGVGMLVLMSAGALLYLFTQYRQWTSYAWRGLLAMFALAWLSGFALKHVEWTQVNGEPISVALVQGNIAQDLKWRAEYHDHTLAMYRDLSRQAAGSDLIVWPETAVPDFKHRVSSYLQVLQDDAKKNHNDVLLGIFIRNPDTQRYYNSVLSINDGVYHKRHLVPLGEYIPLRFLISFFNHWVDIPMSDIESGAMQQPLLRAAGQPLGLSICFEDAFSRDVRRDLPEATLLVNVSNDAWFEDSQEPHQHHAIARMRALETGRYMLRATNTGISSVIDQHGDVIAQAPQFETYVLRARAQPMTGATPYVRWGDSLIVLLALVSLLWAARPFARR